MVNPDGNEKNNITRHPDVAWTYYAWESRLFFISDRDSCHRCYYLYEMDATGNNVKKLTDLRMEDSWMGSRNEAKEMVVTGRIGLHVGTRLKTLSPTIPTKMENTVSTPLPSMAPTNGN